MQFVPQYEQMENELLGTRSATAGKTTKRIGLLSLSAVVVILLVYEVAFILDRKHITVTDLDEDGRFFSQRIYYFSRSPFFNRLKATGVFHPLVLLHGGVLVRDEAATELEVVTALDGSKVPYIVDMKLLDGAVL